MKKTVELGVNTFGFGGLLQQKSLAEIAGTFRENEITCMEPCVLFLGKDERIEKRVATKKSENAAFGGMWLPAEAAQKIHDIRRLGLAVHGIHVMSVALKREIMMRAIAFAKENELSYLVVSLETDSTAKIQKNIPLLQYAAAEASRQGIALLYHNHAEDIKPTGAGCVLDYLLLGVPQLGLQLDLGWVQFAGRDCLQMMEKYSDRIQSLHFKDVWPDAKPGERGKCFTPVGEGCIPIAEIMEKAQGLHLPPYGYVIDQDASFSDILTDVCIGAKHILHADSLAPTAGIYQGDIPLSLMTFPLGNEVLHRNLNFKEICKLASEHGIRALDLMDMEVRMYGVENVKATLAEQHLQVGCLIATTPIEGSSDRAIKRKILNSILLAQKLGTARLMLIPMPQKQPRRAPSLSREEKAERCIHYLRFAVAAARRCNIQICVEDTPSCRVPLSSIAECKYMLEAVPGLGLVFDTANMLPQGDDPIAFYEQLKPYICHVHLKDAVKTTQKSDDCCNDGTYLSCCLWGEGLIPVRELYERLQRDHYAGICTIEYVPPQTLGRIANHLQLRYFLRYLENDVPAQE